MGEVCLLLLKCRADPLAQASDGRNPLDMVPPSELCTQRERRCWKDVFAGTDTGALVDPWKSTAIPVKRMPQARRDRILEMKPVVELGMLVNAPAVVSHTDNEGL